MLRSNDDQRTYASHHHHHLSVVVVEQSQQDDKINASRLIITIRSFSLFRLGVFIGCPVAFFFLLHTHTICLLLRMTQRVSRFIDLLFVYILLSLFPCAILRGNNIIRIIFDKQTIVASVSHYDSLSFVRCFYF